MNKKAFEAYDEARNSDICVDHMPQRTDFAATWYLSPPHLAQLH